MTQDRTRTHALHFEHIETESQRRRLPARQVSLAEIRRQLRDGTEIPVVCSQAVMTSAISWRENVRSKMSGCQQANEGHVGNKATPEYSRTNPTTSKSNQHGVPTEEEFEFCYDRQSHYSTSQCFVPSHPSCLNATRTIEDGYSSEQDHPSVPFSQAEIIQSLSPDRQSFDSYDYITAYEHFDQNAFAPIPILDNCLPRHTKKGCSNITQDIDRLQVSASQDKLAFSQNRFKMQHRSSAQVAETITAGREAISLINQSIAQGEISIRIEKPQSDTTNIDTSIAGIDTSLDASIEGPKGIHDSRKQAIGTRFEHDESRCLTPSVPDDCSTRNQFQLQILPASDAFHPDPASTSENQEVTVLIAQHHENDLLTTKRLTDSRQKSSSTSRKSFTESATPWVLSDITQTTRHSRNSPIDKARVSSGHASLASEGSPRHAESNSATTPTPEAYEPYVAKDKIIPDKSKANAVTSKATIMCIETGHDWDIPSRISDAFYRGSRSDSHFELALSRTEALGIDLPDNYDEIRDSDSERSSETDSQTKQSHDQEFCEWVFKEPDTNAAESMAVRARMLQGPYIKLQKSCLREPIKRKRVNKNEIGLPILIASSSCIDALALPPAGNVTSLPRTLAERSLGARGNLGDVCSSQRQFAHTKVSSPHKGTTRDKVHEGLTRHTQIGNKYQNLDLTQFPNSRLVSRSPCQQNRSLKYPLAANVDGDRVQEYTRF